MSKETLEKWREKYLTHKEKIEYEKMEESTYRKKVVTIQNEIEKLIKKRDKAGYSILFPEKRTEKAIEIQQKIRELQNERLTLYRQIRRNRQKGEIENENK